MASRVAAPTRRAHRIFPWVGRCFFSSSVSGEDDTAAFLRTKFKGLSGGQGPAARRRQGLGRTGMPGRLSDGSVLSAAEGTGTRPELAVPSGSGSLQAAGIGGRICRVSTAHIKEGRMDDAVRYFERRIGPAYETYPGFHGAFLLVDRPGQQVKSVSLWVNEAAMLASTVDEQYQKIAKGLMGMVAGGDPPTAELFEAGSTYGFHAPSAK